MSPSEKPKHNGLRAVTGSGSQNKRPSGDRLDLSSRGSSVAACPDCFGTGMRVEPGVGARRCECQSPEDRQRLLYAARIPERYKNCSIDNFHLEPDDQNHWPHNAAKDILADYPGINRGLLLMGPAGVGKTHLAVAILRGLIESRGVHGMFYQFGSLLKEIQSSYSPISHASELSVLQPVFDAEVLVLDELGAAKTTDWVRETIMQIINTRYNDCRLTIFTTNYLDRPLEHQPEVLEERVGAPVRSRLYEMCVSFEMSGADYRKYLEGKVKER